MARVPKSSKQRGGTTARPFRKILNYKIVLLVLIILVIPFGLALFSTKTTIFIFHISEKIEAFLGLGSEDDAPECPPAIERLIKDAAYENGLDWLLIKAVVKVESGFNPKAVSPDGAQGLMQLMPVTAADLKVKDPHDPAENVFAGVKYLTRLIKRYEGDLDKALAAYNAGPKKVDRYGKVPPFKETEKFIERVKFYYDRYRKEAEAAKREIVIECVEGDTPQPVETADDGDVQVKEEEDVRE